MGIEKKVLSVRLDQEFIDELKLLAKNENRPLSNFIETVLKKHANSEKEKMSAEKLNKDES